jgi:hypothetical protein
MEKSGELDRPQRGFVMAINWLKIEVSTPEKPEILRMSVILGVSPDVVFARVFKVWAWADSNTKECNAPGVTSALLDAVAGMPGIAEAMKKVGWLKEDDAGISFPNADRHLGEGAKQRGLTARRAAKSREQRDKSNAKSNAKCVTKSAPEKRREEKSKEEPPKAPQGEVLVREIENSKSITSPAGPVVFSGRAYHPVEAVAAKRVIEHYRELIPAATSGYRDHDAIVRLMVEGGWTEDRLKASADNYLADCKRHNRKTKSVGSFYADGAFENFAHDLSPPPQSYNLDDDIRAAMKRNAETLARLQTA